MFSKILFLFLGLGVGPILLIAIFFSIPYHFQMTQYKNLVGLFLIFSTVSTLCLAGMVTKLLKEPLNKLLHAQKEIRHGKLECRLSANGNDEFQKLFTGFNKMAAGIEQASKQERQMVETKTLNKLATQVIHDLRAPLASLKVAVNFFNESEVSNIQSQKAMNLIQMSTKRLEEITEELLKKNRAAVSVLNTVLDEAVDQIFIELGSRFPKITTEKKLASPPILLAVAKQDIQRAMINIFTNAAEAMNGEGKIIVTALHKKKFALLQIEDCGPGMTPEILEKVLKGGFTYNKTDGNGIGMTIVREVVEKYKGSLHATSKIGVGTVFQITFPISNQS